MDASEAVDKLRMAIRVLGTFKTYYFEYKSKSNTETPENPWRFQNNVLFSRLDAFIERCHDMLDLQSTCIQFNKLERVEVGGTKGKVLTSGIKTIHADFQRAVERFQQVGCCWGCAAVCTTPAAFTSHLRPRSANISHLPAMVGAHAGSLMHALCSHR
jgi:hypothetical protein